MTCFNRRETTLVALGRLVSQANDLQLDIVLVDDASTDGTAEAVRSEFPQVKVVQTSGDYYWAASMALAESEASKLHNELVLWLNDDVVLDEHVVADVAVAPDDRARQKVRESPDARSRADRRAVSHRLRMDV